MGQSTHFGALQDKSKFPPEIKMPKETKEKKKPVTRYLMREKWQTIGQSVSCTAKWCPARSISILFSFWNASSIPPFTASTNKFDRLFANLNASFKKPNLYILPYGVVKLHINTGTKPVSYKCWSYYLCEASRPEHDVSNLISIYLHYLKSTANGFRIGSRRYPFGTA